MSGLNWLGAVRMKVGGVAGVMFAAACAGGDSGIPTVREAVQSPTSLIVARTAAAARSGDVTTIEGFRARNPMSFVGRAHNAGIRAFFAALSNTHRNDACGALRAAYRAARRSVGADSSRLSIEASTDLYLTAKWRRCSGATARRASLSVAGATSMSTTLLSGNPQPYLDAIDSVVASQPSTNDFIAQIDAIAADAEGELTDGELAVVQVVASVAVESHDYWVVNDGEVEVVDSLEALYGTCLNLAEDPPTCLYATSSNRPPQLSERNVFRYVNVGFQGGCWSEHVSAWQILAWDVAGGAGGAIGGFAVGGPAGAVATGGAAALGASVAEAVHQGIMYVACKLQ